MMYLRNIFAVYFIVFITRCHEVEHKTEITGKPFPGRCINYPKGSLDPRPMACSMLSSTNSFERDLFGLKKLYRNNVWNLVHNCLWPHHNSFRFFCSLLWPVCLDVTKNHVANHTSLVQLVPPCRSLCLEVARFIHQPDIHAESPYPCPSDIFNCSAYAKPRDINFLCVPPVFVGY